MSDISRSEEFRRVTALARQQEAAERAALDAARDRSAQPGDVYLFPGDGDLATRWLVLAVSTEQPDMLFAVPADGNPLFGLADLLLTDERGQRLTIRCGLGLWLPRTTLKTERRIRILPAAQLRNAQEKMRQVLNGALDGPEAARESEANPDYQEWTGLVAAAVERLASTIRIPAIDVIPSEFEPLPTSGQPRAEERTLDHLAAASPEPFAEAAAVPPAAAASRPAYRVDLLYPGELRLLLEPTGVAILYHTESGTAPPPAAVAGTSDAWLPLTWSVTPGGTAARTLAPWSGQSVRLRFGEGEFAREVTISRQ